MKEAVLITDVVNELSVERKILKKYKLILSEPGKLNKKDIPDITGIITGHEIIFDKKLLTKFSNCKALIRYGAGYNNIDIKYAKKKGIKVFNVPDYGSNEVADVALAMAMSFVKDLNEKYFNIIDKNKKKFWNFSSGFVNRRISKLNVGVIGLGRIGSSFAKRAKNLGFNVFFYDPYLKKNVKNFKELKSLSSVFKLCDLITLHVPLTKETNFFITNKLIAKSKSKLILINTARGGLIKDDTIIKNLKNNKILYYGTDVLESEPINFNSKFFSLIKNKNFRSRIILTPHSAFYTKESFFDLRYKAATTLLNYMKNRSTKNCVN